jgi:hypothetical protein
MSAEKSVLLLTDGADTADRNATISYIYALRNATLMELT